MVIWAPLIGTEKNNQSIVAPAFTGPFGNVFLLLLKFSWLSFFFAFVLFSAYYGLADVSDVFYFFFCFGGREKEEEAEAKTGAGVLFIWQ